MEDNDLRTVSRLAMTCMLLAEKADELVTCVCILQDLSETLDDYIPVMATEEVVTKLGKIVEFEDYELRQPAIKCLVTVFASADPSIVDYALAAGILPLFHSVIENAPTQLLEHILFGLSNITAGTETQI